MDTEKEFNMKSRSYWILAISTIPLSITVLAAMPLINQLSLKTISASAWLMEPGDSMFHSQGLFKNSHSEFNQPKIPIDTIYLRFILILSSHLSEAFLKFSFL